MLPLRELQLAMRDLRTQAALLAFAAIVLPPVLFGPWLPLHDLVAFAGLGAHPAKHAYGPLHYAVFQFTYAGHYALSRALTALGLPAPTHILVFYLIQAATLFTITWRLLVRLVPDSPMCAAAIALGALAFWDGQFLWGGPLPFSLASICVLTATCLVAGEAERRAASGPWFGLLLFASLLCHPFALPFALLVAALRIAFVPDARRTTGLLIAGLVLSGWVIARDSPGAEEIQGPFAITWAQVGARFVDLFARDSAVTGYLFGFVPAALRPYFWLLGTLHLIGFALSPVIAWRAVNLPALRLVAVLNTLVGAMYFFTPGLESVIPSWPQRILTFFSPITFAAPVAGIAFLVGRWRSDGRSEAPVRPRVTYLLIPGAVLVWLVSAQLPLLRLSAQVRSSFEHVRGQLLATNAANAFVVTTDLNRIQPVYLRSATFLLFSDPAVVARNLHLFTEWHIQPRHPTRLVEGWFDLGRPRLEAKFSSDASGVSVTLVQPPAGEPPVPRNNNALDDSRVGGLELSLGNELYRAGCFADAIAHYRAAVRLAPKLAEAQQNLGAALYQVGQPQEALAHFQAAARVKPDFVDAHRNAGIVLLELGRRQEAALSFEAALRVNPSDSAAREGLQRARQ